MPFPCMRIDRETHCGDGFFLAFSHRVSPQDERPRLVVVVLSKSLDRVGQKPNHYVWQREERWMRASTSMIAPAKPGIVEGGFITATTQPQSPAKSAFYLRSMLLRIKRSMSRRSTLASKNSIIRHVASPVLFYRVHSAEKLFVKSSDDDHEAEL